MNVEIFTLCREVKRDRIFLTITNAFDSFAMDILPVTLTKDFFIIAKVRIRISEIIESTKIVITDPKDNILLEQEFENLKRPEHPLFDSISVPLVVSLEDLTLNYFGKYNVTLYADGVQQAKIPFFVPNPMIMN